MFSCNGFVYTSFLSLFVTCHVHLNLLHLIILIMFDEEYKLFNVELPYPLIRETRILYPYGATDIITDNVIFVFNSTFTKKIVYIVYLYV
jgi:hypothetical protein